MNSRWGFDLDMSAVRLMRREGGHWQEVAREKIDGPDIEDRLLAMVAKVEKDSAVDLFLPRDQILYTDVKISSKEAAETEIAAAMDGLTPYTLEELEIDWVLNGPNAARVAAIARETVEEAAAFAEVRGLAVAGYSSLADPEDFPRLPVFGGGAVAPSGDEPESTLPEPPVDPEPSVAFSTVREPRASEILTLTTSQATSDGPVVHVSDTTPVMQVKPRVAPLDPGRPLDNAPAAPRVRTDIAAGTLSGAAASLTPAGPSIRIRTHYSKPTQTLAIFAVAAILTIGIAAIVWSILPLAPGGTAPSPAESTDTGLATQTDAPPDAASAAPPAPDLPVPAALLELAGFADSPDLDMAPDAPGAEAPRIARLDAPALNAISPGDALPLQTGQPLERRPETLASLLTDDPVQGLDGSEDTAESTLDIYFASVERRDLAFDAIALPEPGVTAGSDLPQISPPPAAPGETADVASADPTVALPEGPAETSEAPATAAEDTDTPIDDAVAGADESTDPVEATGSDLRPTALAAALPDRAPRARPGRFTEQIERQSYGGRTREELARIAPKRRPDSAQIVAQSDGEARTEASELAVAASGLPRGRPQDFDAIVAAAIVNARAEQLTASVEYDAPDTSAAIEAALADDAEPEPRPQDSPRLAIPSGASVSRQATIENAIPLNKINLVGVYGVPSDRRALLRLPSGRYVKVKVGDRVDGGTVAQIKDSELIYRKGSRTLSLSMPKG